VTIIVAGCVAQQEGQNLLRRCPEVDLVMGPQYANRIADLLEDCSNGNQVVATEATHIMEDSTKPRRQSTVAAWVNVIYGCNERCAFCVVPATRGVEQSRPVESIVREVTELVEQGYKEVTLLGQNIDAYGRDMVPKRKFSDLIRTVGNIEGLDRLRFVTSHPRYMSLGVVDAVAETAAACECFHIPFQSGSNEVLAAMGRGHTREKYLHIVDRIRSRIPDAAITADVIVGFPGETEEQFQETLALMEEVVFDSVNTAAYSPRPNTPAATWPNQVEEHVKQDRLQRINAINLKHAAQRRARMVGRTVEVLIEERNVKIPTQVMGRTRHGYIVYCAGDIDELRGKTVEVEITESATYHLIGNRI
jgi:tRNA-2-methylthio-N6-dimethylallyladenosine synthase